MVLIAVTALWYWGRGLKGLKFVDVVCATRRCRDVAPAGESLSLAVNESNQSKAALLPASLRFVALRSGQPAVFGRVLRRETRFAEAVWLERAANSCPERSVGQLGVACDGEH